MSATTSFGSDMLHMFSGAVKNGNPAIATSVHCTNHATGTVSIEMNFFSIGGSTGYVIATQLASKETKTVSTQNTFYAEILPASALPDINQEVGVMRVTNPVGGKEVIWTAQVVGIGASPETDPPTLIAKLHLFDGDGNLVNPPKKVYDGPGIIYLPAIFKAAN